MEEELNRILHQPIRTRIMAYLLTYGSCTYTALKNKFELSDGHMTTHMRELVGNEYVDVEKKFVDKKPQTTYLITSKGKKAFLDYIEVLKNILIATEP